MAAEKSTSLARRIRIGISGWTYTPWRKKFYPEGMPQRRELEYASRQVNSIEINGTFYSLQKPTSFRKWYETVPDDFVFSIKGGRYITHIQRLKDVDIPLANFFGSGLLELGEKLGPILWQMPPSFRYDPELLENFFKMLPRDMDEASRLAHRHDAKITGHATLTSHHEGPIRHAMEIRHRSFENKEFIDLLRHHRIALVVADTAGKWPFIEDVTADFVYIRLHGAEELYASGYTPKALDIWEKKIACWAGGGTPENAKTITEPPSDRKSGRDVFVYFDNDIKVHAPHDAMALGKRLGLPEPQPLEEE